MLDFIGDLPNPIVETFTQQEEVNQKYNQIFQDIKELAMSSRDGYTEVIKIENINNGSLIRKTTKISSIDFFITDDPLLALLPNPARPQDKCIFFDSQGLAQTHTCTIDLNGQKVNGTTTNPTITDENGWIELTFIHENIGWWITASSP